MAKTMIYYLIAILSVNIAHAQQSVSYFNKVYGNTDTFRLAQVVRPLNNGYIVMGGYSIVGEQGLYISRLNAQGEELWYKKLDSIPSSDAADFGVLTNGSYVIQTTDKHFVATYINDHDIIAVKLDSMGVTSWKYNNLKPNHQSSKQIIQTIDGGFAIVGLDENTTQDTVKSYLLKLSPTGQFQWERTYESHNDARFFSVQQWWDGTYIMGGIAWNGTDYDLWVVKTAANGNTLWTKALGGAYNDCAASVSFLTTWEDWYFNNAPVTYLVSGCDYVEVTFPIEQVVSKQYVAKLTEDGNTLLWEHKYLNPDLFLLSGLQTMPIIYPDGSFLGVNSYYNQDFPDEGFRAGVLIKFRSNGTVEWYKKFFPENTFAEAYLKDLQRTPDGGYVMAGYQYNPSPQKGWVLKLDEDFNTCSFVGCDSTIYTGYPIGLEEVLLDKVAFSLIPNPAQDVVMLQLLQPINNSSNLLVYDISGRLVITINGVYNGMPINVQYLQTGMYYCRLLDSNKTEKLVIIR
jgi:hypothetical protein